MLKPSFQLDGLTSSGSLVTATTKEQHNLQPGASITVTGANESAYNGTFTITNITGYNTFTYAALSTPSVATASGQFYCSVVNWYGCINRVGIFDQQNGLFFEYDGQNLNVVRRYSTFQISGTAAVTAGATSVTGTNTIFSKQLVPGDFIVLRGQSYRVQDIASDTSLTISPGYRAATNLTKGVISKTIEVRTPQSQWNLDKCDGTGPSGYVIDPAKMQMYYIDYSWYGAGFVRFGLRATNGNVIYVHKIVNNNVNYEAYLRSGNLPGRYESVTAPPTTYATANITNTDTSFLVNDTSKFPSSGTLVIRPGSTTNQASQNYEFVNYTGKTATSFTGVSRGKADATINADFTLGSNTLNNITTPVVYLQIGMRVTGPNVSDGTFISAIDSTSATMSKPALNTASAASTYFPAMGNSAQTYTYAATSPISVELAFPQFAASISHWGTSAIMDGRYDDDKSLIFTYGSTSAVTVAASASNAVFSIRVSPSADNGIAAAFGARELINRMQLKLVGFDIAQTATAQPLLITAVLNGKPSGADTWVSPGASGGVNSSLSQIAEHSGATRTISGGEVTAGYLVNSTQTLDLTNVRDLGNSVLGGGGTTFATDGSGTYPDGPDVITFVIKNLGGSAATAVCRISWTEAQA